MKLILFLLLFFRTTFPVLSQVPEINYAQIDSAAIKIKYAGNIEKLTFDLTAQYKSPYEKARAIFTWITENVAYDIKFINKNKKTKWPKCRKKDDCKAVFAKWEREYAEKTASSGKSICYGYSLLFKTMCGFAGIPCNSVSGFQKQEPSQIGKMGRLNHAWNIMLIDGNYYNLDATWAAGGVRRDDRGRLIEFVKRRENYYWLTPLDKFSRNHFPKDTIWPGTSKPDKIKYRDQPFMKNYALPDLDVLLPDSGVVTVCLGDTIRFKIEYRDQVNSIQMNTNLSKNSPTATEIDGKWVENERAFKKQKYVTFQKTGSIYEFQYVADNKNLRYIDILFDTNLILKFKVKMDN